MAKPLALASLEVHAALLSQQAERLRAIAMHTKDEVTKAEAIELAKEMEREIRALRAEIELLEQRSR
jgi:hypothetical protein